MTLTRDNIAVTQIIRVTLRESSTPTNLMLNDKYWAWEQSETGDLYLAVINEGESTGYVIGGGHSHAEACEGARAWMKQQGLSKRGTA